MVLLSDLLPKLATDRAGCYRVCVAPPFVLDEAAAWQTIPEATALFIAALAKLATRFSLPDPVEMEVAAECVNNLHARWDFDYYRWDLRVVERPDGHALVRLERT